MLKQQGKEKWQIKEGISEMCPASLDWPGCAALYEKRAIRANKKENGYRYFSDEDIYRLMQAVYRRKMNDSLEEIRESVKDNRSVAGMRGI